MNLVWHIIKKDLRRFRWELAIWAVAFLYARQGWRADFVITDWRDVLVLVAAIAWGVLSMAMIIGVVQEDNLVDAKAHWRTRAIRPGTLLLAKLGFIGIFFIGLPLMFWLHAVVFGPAHIYINTWWTICPLLVFVPLSFAAMGACTRTSGQALLSWLGVLLLIFLLSRGLEFWLPRPDKLARLAAAQLIPSKGFLIGSYYTTISLLSLANQYLSRRRAVSLLLIGVGAVGSVLIGSFWRWNFLS